MRRAIPVGAALLFLFLAPVARPIAHQAAAPAAGEGEDDDFNTQMMRATVKISHEKSTGTGFVMAAANSKRLILVTAAHVFESIPDDETTLEFRRRETEGVYPKEPVRLAIRKEGKPIWTKHPVEDVAALWIDAPRDADLPRIPVSLLATDDLLKKHKVHPGENVSCLGYPHRNEANEAGFPILRSGAIGSFPLVPTAKSKTFYFSANTFEGDSGGPVYLAREDAKLILGVISGQRFLDEEMKMIYGTTKVRHRLGLAIVVHAAFIKETIERLP